MPPRFYIMHFFCETVAFILYAFVVIIFITLIKLYDRLLNITPLFTQVTIYKQCKTILEKEKKNQVKHKVEPLHFNLLVKSHNNFDFSFFPNNAPIF